MWLADVRDACNFILSATAGKSYTHYAEDLLLRSAVERQFEIIGEALRRLLNQEPGLSLRIHEAREIIEFRNFLSHAYHLIDHTVVWGIIAKNVPILRDKVAEVITERDQASD
ncbi:MAG: HepT-like ribonuclease domain-containing protein [Phycisphaerales bacterium]